MINKKLKWFQLSQRQRMSPFPNYLSMEAVTKEMKSVVGYAYSQIIYLMTEGTFYFFLDKDDYERVGQGILEHVKKDPQFFAKVVRKQKISAKSFYKWLKQHNRPAYLKTISNAKLAGLHREYERRYKQIYARYFPILAVESYLFNYLKDYIDQKESNPKRASKNLNTLITEPRAMVNRQEKIAAFRLCVKIKKNQQWRQIFKKRKSENVIRAIKHHQKLYQLIKNHERRFFWLTRDYEDPILSLNDFIDRFINHLKKDPQKALDKLIQEDHQTKKEKRQITQKLGIDFHYQKMFQSMRDGLYGKELRKSIVSQTLYYYDPVLKAIGQRAHLSLRQVRHLKTEEILDAIIKKRDFTHELNDRIKLSIWYISDGKTRINTGTEAKKSYDYFIKIDPDIKEIYGTPVSPGVMTGSVKVVINPEDFYKVKPGDIIVSIQATPVFSHIIAIAGGLICDGGTGITSHPATLAREVGIPGIVGLRVATKVLRDGQKVIVDGDKGVVKIL